MKGFWKSGKWLGLLILALVFAGCAGGSGSSSSEPALANGPGIHGVPIVVDTNNQTVTFGDEGAAGGRIPASVYGHTMDIINGSTGCAGAGPTVSCWIKLINRDSSNYMANTFVLGTLCADCTTAVILNADLTHGGAYNGTACGPGQSSLDTDANAGCGAASADIDGLGMCYVEDGEFKVTGAWYNTHNCPIHPIPSAFYKPNQMLHPQCGQSTVRWDFDSQSGTYSFMGQIQAQWFPQDPNADGRMNMQDRGTFYVMATDLTNATGIANLNTWLRPGAYRRARVISGWNKTASNTIAVNGYFAVNVAIEDPDRQEAQEVANTFGNHDYDYYWDVAYVLHYNPAVVQLVVGKGGSRTTPGGTVINNGALDNKDCLIQGVNNYCTNFGIQSFEGTAVNLAFSGTGWVALDMSIDDGAGNAVFAPHQTGSYVTFQGGVGHLNLGGMYYYAYPSYPVAPKMNAHYGRAHLNIPVGGVRTWNAAACTSGNIPSHSYIVKQEGVDGDPDMPLGLYYFWVPNNPALSGKGSEFWIESFGSATMLATSWTNGNIYPGGLAVGEDVNVCIPYQAGFPQGCDAGIPAANYFVYGGFEYVNQAIGSSGPSVSGGIQGFGAYQQWSANICVQ